jgi:integrase
MGKVARRPETGRLYLDFRFQGRRCREHLGLADSPANRKTARKLLSQIEEQIALGTFDYAATFPQSKRARQFASPARAPSESRQGGASGRSVEIPAPGPSTPLFRDFAETWFAECEPSWRPRYQQTVRGGLDKHLLPAFGNRPVDAVTRADVLAFRAELAKKEGRGGQMMSNARINSVMTWLRQILTEASLRFGFPPAYTGIKPLKMGKSDVEPFSLAEVNRIIETCRPDWRNYFVVRFFSAMRSGELHGLRWRYVDFQNDLILVRETLVDGQAQPGAKTYESCRDIPMLPPVREALLAQREATPETVEWVFYSSNYQPVDTGNFTLRIWKPLLGYLGLRYRRPYQTRHTTATLLLAAGENPEWIARLMGHSSTEMLFSRYSRYVRDLTRKDGSAIGRILEEQGPTVSRPDAPCSPPRTQERKKKSPNPKRQTRRKQ